jgi:hypothetical protein
MSRGKPLPLGPTARLPKGVKSWEDYAGLPVGEIRAAGDFPWKPLDQPRRSHTTPFASSTLAMAAANELA